MIDDLTYDDTASSWVIRLRLTIGNSSAHVPAVTDWYALIDPAYPLGLVEFYPAEHGGLHATFRHMKGNWSVGMPWRTGMPCLDRRGRWLGSAEFSGQPNTAVGKIRFYAEAALRWLDCAARDALTDDDEAFELPAFPVEFAPVIGFDESSDRLERWKTHFGSSGRCVIRRVRKDVYALDGFLLRNKSAALDRWGTHIAAIDDVSPTFWLTLPRMPVIAPWDVPKTWGELRKAATDMGVDLDLQLKWIYRKCREARHSGTQCVFVGFPIPEFYDGPQQQMHWQPLYLPAPLSGSAFEYARAGDKLVWKLQLEQTLPDDKVLEWGTSENWSESRLRVRGALDEKLRTMRIVLIGSGALGAALAEMLVREGVNDLLLLDYDKLEIGNLRRHTLTMDDAGQYKSLALAKRLNAASPFARVRWGSGYPRRRSDDGALFEGVDLIIDCTANEDVIGHLARRLHDEKQRWFFSGSFNLEADRLFLYTEFGKGVSASRYTAAMRRPLVEEREKLDPKRLNEMQSAGCWNPVFPAPWSNIQVMAAEMLRGIERAVKLGTSPENSVETIPLRAA